VPFWPLDPNPESQTHILESLVIIFWVKKFYNSLKTGPNFFLQHSKRNIFFKFVTFVATKEDMTTPNFFHPSLLLLFLDPGSEIRDPKSGIRDPGWVKNQDPGSGINIPDPQHCV
jgi:hypothetical protein